MGENPIKRDSLKTILKAIKSIEDSDEINRIISKENSPELDEILQEIQATSEKFSYQSKLITKVESRADELFEVIMAIAALDNSKKMEVSDNGDYFDAVAQGLNMLSDHLIDTAVSKNFFDQLIQSIGDTLIVIDNAAKIKIVNNSLINLLEYKENELIKQDIRKIFPDFNKVESSISKQKMFLNQEFVFIKKDQEEVQMLVSISPIVNNEGILDGVACLAQDYTEKKEVEELLQKSKQLAENANKAKSEFVANMSHEIRTPLNAIMGLSDLAIRHNTDPKIKDYLRKTISASRSLRQIINDVLDFSKIEAKQLVIQKIAFDLRSIVYNVSDIVSSNDYSKEIEYLISFDSDIPAILEGDPVLLEQVLINLTNNAIKFTEKGEVLLKIEQLSHKDKMVRVNFIVRDTGIGVDKEKISRLFEPFTQADGTFKRKFGGTGLGLTISRNLVEKMGGVIKVDSEEGKGSTFSFCLDLKVLSENNELEFPVPANLQGMKVLVVDDNKTSREILLDMLTQLSFKAYAVDSGEKALEELIKAQKEKPYDLLLLDWKMPTMDGFETAQKIEIETEIFKKPPKVIMVSAFGDENTREKALKENMQGYIKKPVQPSVLFDTIMDIYEIDGPRLSERSIKKAMDLLQDYPIHGSKVLLVEDNKVNQQIAREILEFAGVIVNVASDGKEAIEVLKKHPSFDAVLMDIQMPEMDGYEATKIIRSDKQHKDLPIIAITAHAMSKDYNECLEAGMNDYISKPFEPERLYLLLNKWINKVKKKEMKQRYNVPQSSETISIQGIDTKKGLNRIFGNHTLYKKLLRDFFEDHKNDLSEIEQQVSTGNTSAAEKTVHALKGAATNLGADDLAKAAAILEDELIYNSFSDTCFDNFKAGFLLVFDALEQSQKMIAVEKQENTKGKAINIKALIEELDTLLREANPEASSKMELLSASLSDKHLVIMKDINDKIDQFEFESAQKSLLKLSKTLDL